jgi:hypothetical protein
MKCMRCNGIMNYERVYFDDIEESWGWSCICCGEYIDPLVLENREYQTLPRRNSPERKEAPVRGFHYDLS